MAPLTHDRNTPEREGAILVLPMATGTTIFAGSLVVVSAAGFAAPGSTATGLVAADTPNLVRTLMATPDLIPICEAVFAGQPVIEKPLKADVSKALGEYRLVAEEGYPTSAGFWGANAKFHTPIDGADSTTPQIMEPVARAISQVIEARLAAI